MLNLEQAKQWYVNTDAVHDFSHIERVYRMAERLAKIEGADLEIVRAAALLHDADGTTPGSDSRLEHHLRSAEFAGSVLKAEGWPEERFQAVQHCIRAHRFRDRSEPPATLEARILFDADKLDVIGAIGVVRAIAYGVIAGQPAYIEPSQRFLESGLKEAGEQHSSYHEYLFKLRKIRDMLYTRTARQVADDRHTYMAEFYDRLRDELKGMR